MAIGTIMAVGSALASIGGGIASAVANRQAQAEQAKQHAQTQAWYQRRLNEDPTQRADNLLYLNRLRDLQQQRAEATAGRAAVMGSTDAAVAADKNAAMQQEAQVIADMAAANEARKDQLEAGMMQEQQAYSAQRAGYNAQRAAGIAAAAGQAMGAAASAIGSGGLESTWTRGAKATPTATAVNPYAKSYLDQQSRNVMRASIV